ncbi:MAG: rhodanese-like domain-containing protein [Vampirovibrionales bacterium]
MTHPLFEHPGFKSISHETLETLLKEAQEHQRDLQLVDVRTMNEVIALGAIPNARVIPLHELPSSVTSLEPEKLVVVYCQHGVRSLEASAYLLLNQNFQQVWSLAEGFATSPHNPHPEPSPV